MALLLEGTWQLGGTPETVDQAELEAMDPLLLVSLHRMSPIYYSRATGPLTKQPNRAHGVDMQSCLLSTCMIGLMMELWFGSHHPVTVDQAELEALDRLLLVRTLEALSCV
jgi:hypothetical protein